jgi:DNA-binding NtrC family response regulator
MDLTQFMNKEDEYLFNSKFESIVVINNYLKDLRREALRGSSPEPSVLLLGEIGVGKESLARMICQGSRRSKNPWLVLNCAITKDDTALEKELFGEEKFVFNQQCILNGLFDFAKGGTLFLEKIERLSPTIQNKLTKTINTGKFSRVGGTEELQFDVRLISEMNQNLDTHSSDNTLSKSLYKLLSGVTLEIPPLRTRPEDILPMAHYFAELHFKYEGKEFRGFTPETEKALISYSWPGNTHELIYLIKRSALLSKPNLPVALESINSSTTSPLETFTSNVSEISVGQESNAETNTYTRLKKQWCNSFEKNYLASALGRHNGNVSAAAREAKLDRSNFLRLMRRHNMKANDYRSGKPVTRNLSLLRAA